MQVGTVEAVFRYPVRSMRGESLDAAPLEKLGVVGDRAYSIVDPAAFAMVSASTHPLDWGGLVDFRASYVESPLLGAPPPPVRLEHTSGATLRTDDDACEAELSRLLGARAALFRGETRGALSSAAARRRAEKSGDPSSIPAVPYPSAPVHLLTRASIRAATALHPDGRFTATRFRPNLLLDTGAAKGFLEADWVGRRLRIGDAVELEIFEECERCGLTTLPQEDLPRDPRILQTLVKHNRTNFGVQLSVRKPGVVRVGDTAALVEE